MNRRENLHRYIPRIDPLELFVNVQNAAKFAIEFRARNMREIQIHTLLIFVDTQTVVHANVENLACSDVARHEIAILGIALFEEVIPLRFGNRFRIARILGLARHPHTAPFATGRFAHQSQLVGSGNRRRMHLNEFAIGIFRTGLHRAAHGASRAGHRHRAPSVNQAATPRGQHDRIRWERANFHRHHVLRDRAPATAIVIDHGTEKIPTFVHFDGTRRMPTPHLFVEGVEQLLTRRGPSKRSPLEQRAPETALIAETLERAIERHTQSIHQVDDFRRPQRHFVHGGLMLQKVAAVNSVVEVEPFVVALLAGRVVNTVDATLSADAVRAFHGGKAHTIDGDSQFGQFHCGGQTSQTTTDDNDTLFSHPKIPSLKLCHAKRKIGHSNGALATEASGFNSIASADRVSVEARSHGSWNSPRDDSSCCLCAKILILAPSPRRLLHLVFLLEPVCARLARVHQPRP